MYEQELKELGLTENEIKIYLVLLEHGTQNPTKLAEKTGLHRSYVYDTTERLLERGIANTVLINNKKSYQAVDPKSLREIFELKLRSIDSIMPNLQELYNTAREETQIELHRGKRVYRTLIKDLVANLKEDDVVLLLGVDENILDSVEPIYLKQYFTILKEKRVREKIIIAEGGKRLPEHNLDYRKLHPKYLGDTTVVIYQNKVYLFIWSRPHFLIAIESQSVADSYRKQFDALWVMSTQ